jgi:2,4-dienoyl-CoA reductase-like NADH-dependent reductase (Old Yellow Enzyme family)
LSYIGTRLNMIESKTSLEALFEPCKVGNIELPNRIVMAPMTRSQSPGGIPTSEVAAYYRRRTEGGVGLIITEGTTVDHPAASNDTSIPVFHGDQALSAWRKVVDEVHAAGGKIMPQLWHQGMARKPGSGHHPDHPSASPSGIVKPGKKVGEPLSAGEVEQIRDAFIDAAVEAKLVGFDGVELHGAHGYLIDQFFWNETNQRDDEFSGSISERTKFACDIIRGIRAAVGENFPIILRFSQWKLQDYDVKLADTPEDLARFLEPLSEAGVDIFHCSQRRFWEPEFDGSDLNLAGWTKKLTGKPAITVGSVGLDDDFINGFMGKSAESAGKEGLDDLLRRVEAEEFDLVAIGRAVLVDPEWPNKVKESRYSELLPFTPDALSVLS